jgi:hypothetical protein
MVSYKLLLFFVWNERIAICLLIHSTYCTNRNHFQQSYTLQVQWILEAVFARLGVRHQARNFGNGGMGTIHNGLAAGSTYGPDVDMLMWDSGMTEKENKAKEVMMRQGIMGGIKVPILWSLTPQILQELNTAAGMDVGYPGTGFSGLPKAQSYEEIQALPWAAQYVRCSNELSGFCRQFEYDGVCWIDRPDYTPVTPQKDAPGGRAGWHPGNRIHQIQGRVLTFTILQALKEALTMWNDAEADNYQLEDEAWHVTAHYERTRTNLAKVPIEDGHCQNYDQFGMEFICKYPMKARTEFTPRAFPSLTNIRNLMPPEMAATINPAPKNVYQPPDVFNPSLHPPVGAVDVLSIVEAGVPFRSLLAPDLATGFYKKPSFSSPPKVPIGKGINLRTQAGDDFCDGSVDSFCDRGSDQECLLRAHNDGRNGLVFDGYSGWTVMNLPDLKNGYIVVKIECWHGSGSAYRTEGWTSINNEQGTRRRRQEEDPNIPPSAADFQNRTDTLSSMDETFNSSKAGRRLKKKKSNVPDYCPEFHLEWAIDGKVTSLNLTEFNEQKKRLQRVIDMVVLLKDPDYTGGEEKEVEVAVRMTGCGRIKTFRMSHIYWS